MAYRQVPLPRRVPGVLPKKTIKTALGRLQKLVADPKGDVVGHLHIEAKHDIVCQSIHTHRS